MSTETESVRVTIWSICLNVFLTGLKLAVGLVIGSAALVADAIHSISDLSTDIVVILGIRISSRPADDSHAYGHGKFETVAASIIGTVLLGAGLYIIWEAGSALYRQEVNIPGYPVIVVAILSIVSKEWMYRVTRRVARRVGSSALYVNAWHHRSDALSSVAVLVGSIAGVAGWGHGDQVAAIVVGAMVCIVGINALWKVFIELTEGSISPSEQESIVKAIQSVQGVKSWHRLRTRLVGREVFMDVHVQVDAGLSVAEGHRICSAVEHAIAGSMERTVNVVVHCEPERQHHVKVADDKDIG
ncbi:MAG: cation transporter [Dehalococcoidia bacterium]|nr:MAG: cation transporter [Dehalococcoidia bacterium]